MHTFVGDYGVRFEYCPDLSGDVEIVDGSNGRLRVPAKALVQFTSDHIINRSKREAALVQTVEQASNQEET